MSEKEEMHFHLKVTLKLFQLLISDFFISFKREKSILTGSSGSVMVIRYKILTSLSLSLYIYIYIYIHARARVYVCVCVCVYASECIQWYICVSANVCKQVKTYVYIYIYIYIFTNQLSTSIHGTRKKQKTPDQEQEKKISRITVQRKKKKVFWGWKRKKRPPRPSPWKKSRGTKSVAKRKPKNPPRILQCYNY